MSKITKLVPVLFTFLIILSSCTNVQTKRLKKLQVFNQEHQEIPIAQVNVHEYMIDSKIDAEAIPRKWSVEVYRNYLSKAEALEEVEHLFLLMESSYGLYHYYGKKRFDQAKAELIKEISSHERTEVSGLAEMYREHLRFIEDYHFRVGRVGLQEEQSIYYSKNVVLQKDGNGYFLVPANQKVLRIISEGSNITLQDNVKRVFDDDSSLRYQIVVRGTKPEKLLLELADGTRKEIELSIYQRKSMIDYDGILYEEWDGIPVLRIGKFLLPDTTEMKQLFEYAEKIRGKNIAILDIRGNAGGNIFSVFQLMEKLAGEVRTKGVELRRTGLNKSKLIENGIDQWYQKAGFDVSHVSYWYKQADAELIKNDTILIVLMDQNTSSSAERLLESLHCVENTIFAGVNSVGNLFSSQENAVYTLHSSILIQYGESMKLYDERYFQEYRGFDPDIYYFGEEKLEELILKYLNS